MPDYRPAFEWTSYAFGVGLLIASAPVQASPPTLPGAVRCSGTLPDETRIACLEEQFERNDHELNAVYKKALARSSASASLRVSQRVWLKSVKTLCEAAGSEFAQESSVQVAVEDCYNRKTIERVAYLKSLPGRR